MSATPPTSLPLRVRGKRQRDPNVLYMYLPMIAGFLLTEYLIYLDRDPVHGFYLGAAVLVLLFMLGLTITRSVLYRGVQVELEWTADGQAYAIIHPSTNYGALDSQLSWSAKYRSRRYFQSVEKAAKDYLGVGHFDPVLTKVLSQTNTDEFRVPLVQSAESPLRITRPETSYWTITLDHNRAYGLIGRTWTMALPYSVMQTRFTTSLSGGS